MGVETAFLNAKLDEEMYTKSLLGIEFPEKGNCFRLMKALYGLKQSPRQWFKRSEEHTSELQSQSY